MVRQEPLIGSLPFRALSHLPPITHPPSKVVSASPTGKPPPFHRERSVPHPDSRPKKRLKRFYPGLTERGVAANSWTCLRHDFSPCPPVLTGIHQKKTPSELVPFLRGGGAVDATVEEPLGPGKTPPTGPGLHSTQVCGTGRSTLTGWPYEYSAGYIGDKRVMKTVNPWFFIRSNSRIPSGPRLLAWRMEVPNNQSPASCGSFRGRILSIGSLSARQLRRVILKRGMDIQTGSVVGPVLRANYRDSILRISSLASDHRNEFSSASTNRAHQLYRFHPGLTERRSDSLRSTFTSCRSPYPIARTSSIVTTQTVPTKHHGSHRTLPFRNGKGGTPCRCRRMGQSAQQSDDPSSFAP